MQAFLERAAVVTDMNRDMAYGQMPDDPLAGKKYVTAGELASWFGDYYKDLNILDEIDYIIC